MQFCAVFVPRGPYSVTDRMYQDAFAILMAAYHPKMELLGISSVFGNASLEYVQSPFPPTWACSSCLRTSRNTTHNAASLLTAMGKHKDVPLHTGLSKPLERPTLHAPTDIHGLSGLDGTDLLPEPECKPSEVPVVQAMAEALRKQPKGTAWIVATGCLTNVGALFREHPDLVSHIKGLSLMGGAIGAGFSDAPLGQVDGKERIGNYTPYAEFNILVDPEAAHEIFSNKALAAKTSVVPLDLSHQVLATEDVRDLLMYGKEGGEKTGKGKTTLRQMLVELLYFFAQTYAAQFGITAGPPLHDPLAVALVLAGTDEEMFFDWDSKKSAQPKHDERFEVTVVTEGTFEEAKDGGKETGRTIAKILPPGSEGVRIPRSCDTAKFWAVIEDCMERADEVNKSLGRN